MVDEQGEEGRFEPILPTADLEAMYDRICHQEFVVTGTAPGSDSSSGGNPSNRHQFRALNARLAAALGLSQALGSSPTPLSPPSAFTPLLLPPALSLEAARL